MSGIGLIVVDPVHFHAALVQKEMYPNLSPEVHVYAPVGPDLVDYLTRIARFNTRKEQPTHWEIEVHACRDFLERMRHERPGTVAKRPNFELFAAEPAQQVFDLIERLDSGGGVVDAGGQRFDRDVHE